MQVDLMLWPFQVSLLFGYSVYPNIFYFVQLKRWPFDKYCPRGLMDYEAVAYHLESGHLGGLGTDVTWTEPFNPDDQILKFQNVIVTPHVAGVTEHSYRSMAKV
ncbi:hypothetical protein CK203_058062 [Vitis vinifera]|uniref:D-isomer specific 2-hydroxyacid dehydrogenase NAD-binding domain-containing protein n=1 Tax=Vitis vinifera TaxID=29760 RepID=A0A438GEY9_VITVI|nr:hypothetical protein CK203_058062 [Vitis vinifera]